jgi:hypothetical protein
VTPTNSGTLRTASSGPRRTARPCPCVMADRQPLVGPSEDHLGGDDEARKPQRVDLGTADADAASLLGPMELAER